jgi:non-ribosomal peptide synthetase-like protein
MPEWMLGPLNPAEPPRASNFRSAAARSELVLVDQHEAQGWRVRQDDRLDNVFEQRCDWIREYGRAGQLAVDSDGLSLTYEELDAQANRLARYLRLHGVWAGDRIALLFDRPAIAYVAVLAVLKIGATCVPLDAGAPDERLAFVVTDARVRITLTQSHLRGRVGGVSSLQDVLGGEVISLDQAARLIAEMSRHRLQPAERGHHPDQLAYLAYPHGPSGWLEGVEIGHRSLCNFARVAAEIYGLRGHRFHQGRPLGSAGAVEEIWVAWAAGATLVPGPAGGSLRGRDLHAFLSAERVTVLWATPTLLTTLEEDLPDLRLLLVSGEACPQGLVARWHRRGRRFLNAYRPSGAIFTATWAEVHSGTPVTIGVPLPTYAAVILDPDEPRRALPRGTAGEIGIAGIGLSCGYPSGNDLTEEAFVEDFLGIPGNPSGRIYRTGDLGRVTDTGEIEHLGRIDRQVYVQGARVDLTEVESVLLTAPGVAGAIVTPNHSTPGPVELAGYYTLRADTPAIDEQQIRSWLRDRLPPHQVPGRLERLDAIPMTAQNVADRAGLPAPVSRGTELDQLRAENAKLLDQLYGGPEPDSDWMQRLTTPPQPATPVGEPGPDWMLRLTAPAQPATEPGTPVGDPIVRSRPVVEPPLAAPSAMPSAAGTAEIAVAQLLAEVLGVERVAVDSHFFDDLGADSMVMTKFCARLRRQPELPNVSIKDVYANPTVATLTAAFAPATSATVLASPAAPASSPVAARLAQLLAEVLDVEHVAVGSHFFDDLGADSMLMTRFCARLRKQPDLPNVSIKDVYAHPTIASLAAAHAPATPSPARVFGIASPRAPAFEVGSAPGLRPVEAARRVGTFGYLLCGLLQFAIFVGYAFLAGAAMDIAYVWISAGAGLHEVYLRSVLMGAGAFGVLCTLPIVAKWVLIGRWKPREIRAWSLGYLRFWIVKALVRANPLALLMNGTPLYNVYLWLLGAKIGRNVVILTRHVPVCTDLLSIGEGTVIRKDVFLNCYRAHDGMIQTGPVTIGSDAVIGDKSVLDIGTAMGDGAQLGHASALHTGQRVPAGQRWHGSPGEPTDVDFRLVGPAPCGILRKTYYVLMQLVKALGVFLPLAFGGLTLLLIEVPQLRVLFEPEHHAVTTARFYIDALIFSAVTFFGGLLVGLLVVWTLPRLLNVFIDPGRVYRLYGFHYSLQRTIFRLTNVKLFVYLFGDSSYIVGYLRMLGYDLGKVEQTGSNFGSVVMHETPFLSSVGTGTVIADGLSMMNTAYSGTSFRVDRATIGAHSFLGNNIPYPAQSRVGDNCLLANKVMVPIDGEVREGVGLLGSPAFEIPRSVRRDLAYDLGSREELRRGLRRKNRHNLVTLGVALLVRWGYVLGLMLLALATADMHTQFGALVVAGEIVASLLFTIAYFVLTERMGAGFRRLRPKSCSIYDPIFWRHERYWKMMLLPQIDKVLAGTPFKNVVSRLSGNRIGKQVFDNGASQTERTLVRIGDRCTFNEGSIIQPHSQEDGAFKSDHITIGAGCTLGVGALVHYGATVGDGTTIAPDSFLMKGEEVPANEHWGGNPAVFLEERPPHEAVPTGDAGRRLVTTRSG